MPHASKWQSLGEVLSLDEDRLDEIFTNNMMDEACLEEMLEHYLQRSDLNHSWEEIEAALEKIKKAKDTSGKSLHTALSLINLLRCITQHTALYIS